VGVPAEEKLAALADTHVAQEVPPKRPDEGDDAKSTTDGSGEATRPAPAAWPGGNAPAHEPDSDLAGENVAHGPASQGTVGTKPQDDAQIPPAVKGNQPIAAKAKPTNVKPDVWPPDAGWHFRPGEFAFNGVTGKCKGKVF